MTTAIESLIARANAEEGSPGYHVTARFADGSVIDAPYLEVGPNWMTVAEIEAEPFMVLVADATSIRINWSPGEAYATGPRFEDVVPPSPSPRM
jgi:hypothetical protein